VERQRQIDGWTDIYDEVNHQSLFATLRKHQELALGAPLSNILFVKLSFIDRKVPKKKVPKKERLKFHLGLAEHFWNVTPCIDRRV
jgi:hypothetical protein